MHLPKVRECKKYEIAKYIKLMLNMYKDIYINEFDIEVEYFEKWDFYKVSIFRDSLCGNGRGDKSYRDVKWKETTTSMRELFDMYSEESCIWRWKDYSYYRDKDVETEDDGSIPGVLYFIKAKELEP